jgi:phage baseplate assembly protein W
MPTRTYTDIDMNFTRHPVTGDIALKYDASAIKAAVKHLVMTRFYERLFHSEIGTNVPDLLFELTGPSLSIRLKKSITDVINNYEPRVVLISVDVLYQNDSHEIQVTIFFRIVNTETPLSVDLILERTR